MNGRYADLGAYSDWAEHRIAEDGLFPAAPPGEETRERIRRALGVPGAGRDAAAAPRDARVEHTWQENGLRGEAVSWSVGHGPRTGAFLLRPDTADRLPGVVALHEHGGVKFYGKEKIADGPGGPERDLRAVRDTWYGGRAWANALARRGFAVLVHDVFLWGSRRFALPPGAVPSRGTGADGPDGEPGPEPGRAEHYDLLAREHEHTVAKYCTLLGTSVAGTIVREDHAAVRYLAARPEVAPDRVGCAGFSGGGARAVLLQAVCDGVAATAVAGMMSSFRGLLDRHVAPHSWMLFPPGLGRVADWPDIAACRAPQPLLVQYQRGDALFSPEGMHAAHRTLQRRYARAGRPEGYAFRFTDGPHRFDRDAQETAADFLERALGGRTAR